MRSVSQPMSLAAHTLCLRGARLAVSLLAVALCGTLAAEDVPLKYEPGRKKDRFEVLQLLRDGTPIPAQKQEKFAGYFNFFILPPFAMPQKQDELPQERAEIRKYFATAKIGVPYDELNKLVLNYMQNVILKNPRIKSHVARYNAVLAIGDLNAFEGNTSGGRYPKPLPEALAVLVRLLQEEQQPVYLQVAAIVGIQRHASMNAVYPIDPAAKLAIAKPMLALLQQPNPSAGSTLSGHAYLRAMAADILAQLNDPKLNDALLAAIQKSLNEPLAPRSMKMALCGSVGLVEVPKPSKVDLAQLTGSVGRAVIEACEQELARSEEQELKRQEAVDPDLRRLSYFLHQADLAFKGLSGRRSGLAAGTEGTPNGSLIAGVGNQFSTLVKELEDMAETLAKEKKNRDNADASDPASARNAFAMNDPASRGYIDREAMRAKLAEIKAALPGPAKAATVTPDVARKERVAGASK